VNALQLRDLLTGTEESLALFRRAAAMPRCRFPVDWEAGAGALFPHYPKLLTLARLAGAHAIFSAHGGDATTAVTDLTAIVGMARHIGREPVMIGLLIQYRCLAFVGTSLEQVLELTSPSEAECRQLAQELAAVDLDDPFERAVETERCLGLWCFDVVTGSDPTKLPTILGVDDPILWVSTRLGPLGRPLTKMDELFYLRAMAQQVARAKQGDWRPAAPLTEPRITFPWYAPVSRIVLPALERVRERRQEALARLALARWGLALTVSHQQSGQFPASLSDARRAVNWSLPNDPLTGRDLVYHPQGSGYLLYSLGANGRDDGGRNTADRKHRDSSRLSADQDDIAWWFGNEPDSVRSRQP
jgi:hypothetical protein